MRHPLSRFTVPTLPLVAGFRAPAPRPCRCRPTLIALDSEEGEALLFDAEARADYTPLVDAVRHAGRTRPFAAPPRSPWS